MADGIPITPGVGATCDTDDCSGSGGAHVQRIKPCWGPDGVRTDPDHAVGKGLPVQDAPISYDNFLTAATTNARVVKNAPGKLRSVHVFNTALYPIFVKFHDTAAAPTPGTTPVVKRVAVQAGKERDVVLRGAHVFAAGIALSVTKGIADADTVAVALNDASIEVGYE